VPPVSESPSPSLHEASPEASTSPLDNIVIVLSGTQHPGNIGSAARAMMTMGLMQLRLVNPHRFPHEQATAMASGAQSVLDSAQLFESLEAAVADCAFVVGSSSRRRYLGDEPLSPAETASVLLETAGAAESAARVALVFGCERTGLTAEELDRCHRLTTIPSNPVYPSLNLAAAVQLLCWELRRAAIAPPKISLKEDPGYMNGRFGPPTAEQMEQFYEHLERVLLGTGFLDPRNPRLLTRRLRQLFNRARPDTNELNILRGILKSVERPKKRTPRVKPGPAAGPEAGG
jgi:TrmH family RNA methyltransferase